MICNLTQDLRSDLETAVSHPLVTARRWL
uniref:Uncharacterized protein n=1 Tax=Arundo donax TaxID=35708 RepID=A0A0A8YQU5_ARUDO